MKLLQYISGFVIAVLLLAAPAIAADWLNYDESKGGDMAYIDMESMRYISVNDIRILKKVEPVGLSTIVYVLSEIEMDCENKMMRYLNNTIYFKDGKSSSYSKNEKFRKITVKDEDESLMELICSLKKRK